MISNNKLPDMQKSTEGFSKRPINKVGVRGIKLRLPINTRGGDVQTVTAEVSSYCNLSAELKGINMSRISRTLISELENSKDGIGDLSKFAEELRTAHNTDNIYVKAKFEYQVETKSPMSGEKSFEPVNVIFEATLQDSHLRRYLTVESTGMSLCPCSKEMSLLMNQLTPSEKDAISSLPGELQLKIAMAGFGAHNQNSIVEVKVELVDGAQTVWIEELIDIANKAVSSPVHNTLKREDEKYVTEVSYLGGYFDDDKQFVLVDGTGPKFVEDIVRCAADELDILLDSNRVQDYVVVCNNDESIHPNALYATAILSAGRDLK